jgi:hypothetical protein
MFQSFSMPPWLILVLFIVGSIVFVALEVSAVTGSWRTFLPVVKTLGRAVMWLAVLGFAAWVVGIYTA